MKIRHNDGHPAEDAIMTKVSITCEKAAHLSLYNLS